MLTPRYITKTINSGASETVRTYGRHILIVSISASTMTLSIDDDPPQQIAVREHIDCEDRKYNRITLANTGLVVSTITLFVSEVFVDLQSDDGQILAALAASAANIEQEVAGSATATQKVATNVARTGVGNTLIFAANVNRTEVEISAPESNGGYVYLGISGAHCAVADCFFVLYPGGVWWTDRYKGAIYACGSDANQFAQGREC
jgi:hypothetical protein